MRFSARRLIAISGWVLAAVLVVLYLRSKYEISFHKRTELDQPLTSTPPPSGLSHQAAPATKAEPAVHQTVPAPQPQRMLSTEELFQSASPAVVLVEVYDNEGHRRGQGSGFVASNDGSVITNYHVIRGAYRATAKFSDGMFAPVSGILAYDPSHDVSVIKIQAPSPPTLKLGDSDTLRVGEHVVAIGSPLGFQNSVSEGIVSGIRGSFAVPINWAKRYLGGPPPRSLAEVAQENTVVQRILSGYISVPAGQTRDWRFTFDPRVMSAAELHGEIHSKGGFGGQITLRLYNGNELVYNCPRQTDCAIHEDLSRPGIYTLVLDNRASLMFPREVTAEIELRYVK